MLLRQPSRRARWCSPKRSRAWRVDALILKAHPRSVLPGVRNSLEGYFEFEKLNTNWRTEIIAGFTTFVTMAYIVLVNPSILHDAGMPLPAVFAATCISAAVGTLLMGILARFLIVLAPGMGLNAYFTYTVVKGMGVPWQTALGAVFLSGVAFLVLIWSSAPALGCLSRSSDCATQVS